MNFGEEIRKLRERHKLSLAELASSSGVSRATISSIERGLQEPRLQTVSVLLEFLGYEMRVQPRRVPAPLPLSPTPMNPCGLDTLEIMSWHLDEADDYEEDRQVRRVIKPDEAMRSRR